MAWLMLVLTLLAVPFWQSKPPADWTEDQLQEMLTDSPWAQMTKPPGEGSPGPAVQVYLASAKVMDDAEQERRRRSIRKPNGARSEDEMYQDYRAWLRENRDTQIVLAVAAVGDRRAFEVAEEMRQMEEHCVMRIGRKKIKLSGHFPPSFTDPYLRLAFPRPAGVDSKTINFELYVPGVPEPFREAEFSVKEMTVNGKLDM